MKHLKKIIILILLIIVFLIFFFILFKKNTDSNKDNIVKKEKNADNAPVIEINGDDIVTIKQGQRYIENGAVAYDDIDGDISSKIKIDSNLNSNKEGNYLINYYVSDNSGNQTSVTRRVIVEKNEDKKQESKNTSKENKKNNTISKKVDNSTYNVISNNDIDSFLEKYSNNISVGYYNFKNNSVYYYNKDEVYYGASLIKTLDALYLYDKGLVNDSLKEYIKKAISISDNDAHSYLVSYIGKNNLKAYGESLGATECLKTKGVYGNTKVDDQIIYFRKLYEIVKNDSELKSFFINDQGNYLDIENVDILHKYGYLNEYYHDAGIIMDKNPYILVVLTKYGKNDFGEIYTVINNVSEYVYNKHINGEI